MTEAASNNFINLFPFLIDYRIIGSLTNSRRISKRACVLIGTRFRYKYGNEMIFADGMWHYKNRPIRKFEVVGLYGF